MDEKNAIFVLYKNLLGLYPRQFQEQMGESMEQTFHDLYKEQNGQSGYHFFLLAIFAETTVGIVREHVLLFIEGNAMKNILANPTSAAILSFLLALPIGFLRLALGSDIEFFVAPIESILTIDGSQPSALGYTIICGGMLLLPVAFALNLQPIWRHRASEGNKRFPVINLMVGTIIFLVIAVTWGALFIEEISCLQGIRCD